MDSTNNIRHKLSTIEGMQSVLLKQKATALAGLDSCKSILDQKSQIDAFLKQYEKSAFQAGGKIMCNLLGGMLTDVFGVEQSVLLESKVVRNAPELYISTEKDGFNSDILSGRGGSVVNIIATALRIIALVQSPNRKIMALDEADCWLSPQLVPKYFDVINQVCKDVGVQVVFLSHHYNAITSKDVKDVLLIKNKGAIDVVRDSKGDMPEIGRSDDPVVAERMQQALTNMHLKNIMAHTDTHIELGSGLNLIKGDNDTGKSCMLRGLDALRSNSFCGVDKFIRNGENIGSISLDFADGATIKWTVDITNAKQTAKGLKGVKTSYALIESDTDEVIESVTINLDEPVPEFIESQLCMSKTSAGFDVNISHQLDPLGILNPAIPPSSRAKMIDLGREFELSIHLFNAHRDKLKTINSEKRAFNSTLKSTNNELSRIGEGTELVKVVDMLDEVLEQYEELSSEIVEISNVISQLQETPDIANVQDIAPMENIIKICGFFDKAHGHIDSILDKQQVAVDLDSLPKTPLLDVTGIERCITMIDSLDKTVLTCEENLFLLSEAQHEASTMALPSQSSHFDNALGCLNGIEQLTEYLTKSIALIDTVSKVDLDILETSSNLSKEQAKYKLAEKSTERCKECGQLLNNEEVKYAS